MTKCDDCLNEFEKLYMFRDEDGRKVYVCSRCKKKNYPKLTKIGFKLRGPTLDKKK